MQKIQKTIYIKGMHCASCEILIKQASEAIDGVKVEYISANKGRMHVELANGNLLPKIEKAIKDAGYQVFDKAPKQNEQKTNRKMLGRSIVIVGILAFIFNKFDLIQYLPSTSNGLSLGMALLIGIIASVSTCLAIVGSIVIGFSEYGDTETGTKKHIKTQIMFHIGRIGGFFILGGLLGLLGKAITLSLTMTTILTIIVGIVVLWMGLHLLKLAPNISALGIHIPKKRSEKTLTTKNPILAPMVGALTFFLPCGFTLSMQLLAINTGNFWMGGSAMALFALGTVPVLFAVGLGSSYIKDRSPEKSKKFTLLHTIIGMLIVFFGIFMIINGRKLLGGTATNTGNQQTTNFTGEYERIEIGHNGWNTIPEIINLDAGKNYELVIIPSENGKGCMVNLTIPGLDRKINRIIKDQPIIYRFTNTKAGRYSIVCGTMGMRQGSIIIQ